MIGATQEEKLHNTAQIEDEARHTVFYDRFHREVVGLQGDDIMDILDASFPWVPDAWPSSARCRRAIRRPGPAEPAGKRMAAETAR